MNSFDQAQMGIQKKMYMKSRCSFVVYQVDLCLQYNFKRTITLKMSVDIDS